MFYSHELLSLRHKGKLARCWLAASVNDQIFKQMCKSSTVNGISLCDLCNEIINIIQTESNETHRRFSLYLSSQLMYGAVKILSYQTTSLQNQVFQMDKKALYYRKNETYEVQNTSALVKDYNVQLDTNLPFLQGKFDMNNKMEAIVSISKQLHMMHDATCLDFGALTHEQLNFLHLTDDDISLLVSLVPLPIILGSSVNTEEVFDRVHATNLNLDDELNDAFSSNEKILLDFENSELSMDKNEIEISISPIHGDISEDQIRQVTFIESILPVVTMQEIESKKSDLLNLQKRQPLKEKHMETLPKRRRLRFEDESDVGEVATTRIPETTVVCTPATDYPSELSQNLELAQDNLLQVERKSKKKRLFADKNTQLSSKMIRKWLSNTNPRTMLSNIKNVNIPASKDILKAPSTNFTSIHERKWNNSLSTLFHMHTVTIFEQKTMATDYEELVEKSTEFTRFENGNNKTAELLSELSSALGKSTEVSKNITLEKNITIAVDEFPQISKVHDMLESITDVPEVIQSPEITEDTLIPDTSHNFSTSSSCLMTKQELLVLLEIIWQSTDFAKFNDIISQKHYSKLDASFCLSCLLELHKENTIILKQIVPYDIIWIQKYA